MRRSTLAAFAAIITAGLALAFAGCSTTAGTIDAAATRLKYSDPKSGKSFEIVLPKEMKSNTLVLDVDPTTGHVNLNANGLQSSSTQLVESAAAGEATAIASMAGAFQSLAPALATAAAAGVSAANPALAPAANAAASAVRAASPPVTVPALPPAATTTITVPPMTLTPPATPTQ